MGQYTQVEYHGVTLNKRTLRALKWAEGKAGFTFPLAQGSYNRGVGASAGTHNGGGAIDVGCAGLSLRQRRRAVRALKLAGFAAWFRPSVPGVWGPHIHALCIGDKQMAWAAERQVDSFDAGRDGLAGNRVDGSFRPEPARRWSWLRNRPVRRG